MVPESWKASVALPLLRREKNAYCFVVLSTTSLTLYVCKVIEHLVRRLLIWLLEQYNLMHCKFGSFREGRPRADAICDRLLT